MIIVRDSVSFENNVKELYTFETTGMKRKDK